MKFFFLNLAQAFAQEAQRAVDNVGHVAEQMGHEAGVIPWLSIFVQSFNFILLFGLLFFLLRKAVKHHFAERAETYRELVDRAEYARKEAEQSRSEMQTRLADLEVSASKSVEQAKSEAQQLRAKLMEEAKQ